MLINPDSFVREPHWNFGDGTTGTGPKVTHTYSDAAMYIMSLQILGREVTRTWSNLTFQTEFPDQPFFIADIQTFYGSDTAVIRTQGLSTTSTQVKIEEEQSKDAQKLLQ